MYLSSESTLNSMDDGDSEPMYQVRWFVGLSFQKDQVPAGQSINLTDDIQRFTDVVHQQSKQSGLYKPHMTIKCEYGKFPKKKLCQNFQNFRSNFQF